MSNLIKINLMYTFLLLTSYGYSETLVTINEIELATTKEYNDPSKFGGIDFLRKVVKPKLASKNIEHKMKSSKSFFHPIKEQNISYSNSPNNEKVLSGKWCGSHKDLEEINYAKKKGDYCIYKKDKEFFRFTALWSITSSAVKSFYTIDDTFVIETENQIFIDKQNINDKMNASKTFLARHFFEKPLFLLTKKEKSYVVYDYKIISKGYDYIFHYGCCERSVMNPKTHLNGVSFYAKRDDQWVLVSVEIKNEP